MSVKDLLGKIVAGDREGALEEFEQIMAEKASDGINEKRIETAQAMFGEGKSEYEKGKDKFEADKEEEKADDDEEKADKENDDSEDDDSGSDDDKGDDDKGDDSEDDDKKDKKPAFGKKEVTEGTLEENHSIYMRLNGDLKTDWILAKKRDGSFHTYKSKEEATKVSKALKGKDMEYKVIKNK